MATMVKTDDLWLAELQAIVRTGPWSSATDVLQAALETLLQAHPELRLPVAAELYRQDQISLSRGAEIAATDLWSFKDYLDTLGIEIYGPESTAEELDKLIEAFESGVHR